MASGQWSVKKDGGILGDRGLERPGATAQRRERALWGGGRGRPLLARRVGMGRRKAALAGASGWCGNGGRGKAAIAGMCET